MTIDETAKIIAIINKLYPTWSKDRDINFAIQTWQKIFEDDEAKTVAQALSAFYATDTKGFAPVPGQLKELMIRGDDLSEQEAWTIVYRAITNSNHHAKEEFYNLPDACRQAIGSYEILHTWARMPEADVQTVIASNFMRSYKARAYHVRELKKLPSSLKALIAPIIKSIDPPPEETPVLPSQPYEGTSMPGSIKTFLDDFFSKRTNKGKEKNNPMPLPAQCNHQYDQHPHHQDQKGVQYD